MQMFGDLLWLLTMVRSLPYSFPMAPAASSQRGSWTARLLLSTLGRLLTCPGGCGFPGDQYTLILRKISWKAEFLKLRNEDMVSPMTKGILPDFCKPVTFLKCFQCSSIFLQHFLKVPFYRVSRRNPWGSIREHVGWECGDINTGKEACNPWSLGWKSSWGHSAN